MLHARDLRRAAQVLHVLDEFGQTDDCDYGDAELLANFLDRG
jgi:hypothetical protein